MSNMSSPWYVEGNSLTGLAELTNKASNSPRFDQERLEHPTYLATTPLSFLFRPGTSILIPIGHFEGSVTKKQAYRWNGRQYTRGGLCTYIFCTIACTDN
jgi:hypothetical protein